jgi:hypothetical protein
MPPGIRVALMGVKKVLVEADKLKERYAKAVEAGVYGLGSEIMTDSKGRVPVDLGALKGSGYVTLPVVTRDAVRVELGYGGPAKAYAVVQHERTEYKHETGEAKFLENAVNAASGGAVRRIMDIARQAFQAGAGASRGGNPKTPDSGQRGGGSKGEG